MASARPPPARPKPPNSPCAAGEPPHRADVRAARDEPETGADPRERPSGEREPRSPGAAIDRPAKTIDEGEPDDARAPGSVAVTPPASRDLHGDVRREQRRREQADDGQADVVAVGEHRCDRAGVRDVPPRGEAERAPADDRPLHATARTTGPGSSTRSPERRALLPEMISAVSASGPATAGA